MKAKALQLGKAMSAALFVLLLVVVGMKNALAQTQVATLQHGDDVSAYYGVNAFVEAHTAAQAGDIITLSSGTFTPCNITKAITLRGAGCAVDTVAGTNPTFFGSSITLNVADTDNFLVIEGFLFTNDVYIKKLHSPVFSKCIFMTRFYGSSSSNDGMTDAQFIHCIINDIYLRFASNTKLINSVVADLDGIDNTHEVLLYNSIMKYHDTNNYYGSISAYNSIFVRTTSGMPYSNCIFDNCIGINTYNSSYDNYGPFGQGYTNGCTTYTSFEEVFESFTGTFDLDQSYKLKDEIATSILGNDGTQVGIYGGFKPYSNRPTYMVLKRCNVANKSTIDGKLSVDIEVVTEE